MLNIVGTKRPRDQFVFEVSSNTKYKPVTSVYDRYSTKTSDCFMFCEATYYNRQTITWNYHIGLAVSDEIDNANNALNIKSKNKFDWTALMYHRLIGIGSFGKVFIASWSNRIKTSRHIQPNSRICLVKFITFRTGSDLQDHYLHLMQERDSLIRLGGIWTPKLYSSFVEPKMAAVFIQEYIDGANLSYVKKVICSDHSLDMYGILAKTQNDPRYSEMIPVINDRDFEIIRFYMGELLMAIKFIHDCGILHRDLKENNVLITRDGHLKIIDFGLSEQRCSCRNDDPRFFGCYSSHLMKPFRNSTERLWGNRYYAAPEYISHEETMFSDRGDYWAVGIIFFHIVFGCRPYRYILRNKIFELNNSIKNWQKESFMTSNILNRRCRNHKAFVTAFFKLISSSENRLGDNNFDNATQQWEPATWEIFRDIDLDNLRFYPAPLKVPSTLLTHDPNICLDYNLIKSCLVVDNFQEQLTCPNFNFINAKANDFYAHMIL